MQNDQGNNTQGPRTSPDQIYDISADDIKPVNEVESIKTATTPETIEAKQKLNEEIMSALKNIGQNDSQTGSFANAGEFSMPSKPQSSDPVPTAEAVTNPADATDTKSVPSQSVTPSIPGGSDSTASVSVPPKMNDVQTQSAQPDINQLHKSPVPAPAPVPEPKPQTTNTAANGNSIDAQNGENNNPHFSEKALRTYESDVAEFMAQRRTSMASIAVAEKKRQAQETKAASAPARQNTSTNPRLSGIQPNLVQYPQMQSAGIDTSPQQPEPAQSVPIQESREPSRFARTVFILLWSLIFIDAGITAVYYFYKKSPISNISPITAPTVNNTLIRTDLSQRVSVANMAPKQIVNSVDSALNEPQEANTIREIILIDSSGTKITGQDMLNRLDISAPDMLKRTINGDWMLGSYSDGSFNNAFVIATTDYFQNAFSGMLSWERVVIDDLSLYLPDPQKLLDEHNASLLTAQDGTSTQSNANATSTANDTNTTSTASTTSIAVEKYITPYPTIKGQFIDRIVRNKDVREFVDQYGNIIFMYSFVDNNHLVFARNEGTLAEIIARLEQKSFVR